MIKASHIVVKDITGSEEIIMATNWRVQEGVLLLMDDKDFLVRMYSVANIIYMYPVA